MYKQPKKPSLFFLSTALFFKLPFGRKVLFICSFIGVITLFLPWFSEGLRMFNVFEKFTIMGIMLALITVSLLWIAIREIYFYKKYFLGVVNFYAYLILLLAGIYTLLLQTSALYELLNYNPRANISFGGMILFFSYGLSLFGLFISKNHIAHKPQKKEYKNPNDIHVENVSLNIEEYKK